MQLIAFMLIIRYNPQYGLGYKWNPDNLIIQVGDTVQWSWTGSPFAATRNIAQVISTIPPIT